MSSFRDALRQLHIDCLLLARQYLIALAAGLRVLRQLCLDADKRIGDHVDDLLGIERGDR